MKLHPVGELLKGSKFAKDSKTVKAIEQTFASAKIQTLSDLDNAPRALPFNIAGFSVYQLVSFLRTAQLEAEAKKNAKAMPAPVTTTKEK